MYLRQVSGREHRTQEPCGSAFNALPLSYPQPLKSLFFLFLGNTLNASIPTSGGAA